MKFTEETLLSPNETQISLEIIVLDADNIRYPNRYDEYVLTFMPLNHTDEQRFHEVAEKCMMNIERMKGPWSTKRPNKKFITPRDKFFYSSQLFAPKINDKELHHDYMPNRKASIKGHFRDLPNGDVVFNIEYLDFYLEELLEDRLKREWEENTRPPCDLDW